MLIFVIRPFQWPIFIKIQTESIAFYPIHLNDRIFKSIYQNSLGLVLKSYEVLVVSGVERLADPGIPDLQILGRLMKAADGKFPARGRDPICKRETTAESDW